ncbi:sulfatase [Pontiellaceae bacterium B12227]|nr:sulfatase [Pontiellaceae bacterium B12227]
MNKRTVIIRLWIAVIFCGTASARASQEKRPNILFIIADDLGARLGCYDDALAVTPNLDRLALQGVVFRNAYCQYHTCGPSRASMMSGKYPFESGYTHNKDGTYGQYMPDFTSLPRLFRENGYRTARVGKVYHMGIPKGIGGAGTDDPAGWDVAINNTGWDAFEKNWSKATHWGERDSAGVRIRYSAPEIEDRESADGQGLVEAIQLLEKHHPQKTGQPFFLAYGMFRPHPPMIVPRRHWDAVNPAEIILPMVPENDRDDIPKVNWHRHGPEYNFIPEEHARNYTHAYYAAIHFVDHLAGQLIQALETQGLADNTIIVFTGDQGFMLGEHGHWHKSSMFEEAQRVPLIIVDPRAKEKGAQVSGLVGLIDLYPTLCDLAGIVPKHLLSGISLKPQLYDVSAKTKQCEFIMGSPNGYTIRTPKYAYTEWRKAGKKTGDAMLYDLENDPREFTNLINLPEYQEVQRELERQLDARLEAAARGCDQ